MKYFYVLVLLLVACLTDGRLNGTSECGCKCQNGRDGRDGRDGVSIQGAPGRDGSNGQDGRDCIDCARGPKGDKGDVGPPGHNGATGPAGPAGARGPKGDAGHNGAKGDRGSAGAKGDRGTKGDRGVCDSKALSTLQHTMSALQNDVKTAKAESAASKQLVAKLNSQIAGLQKQISDLKKSTVQVAPGQKLNQKLLPGGYSDYSVNDLQWHTSHMVAAAACRAVTAYTGAGSVPNRVFARASGQSCADACKATPYNQCDAEISYMGTVKKATSSKQELGWFANHGCADKAKYGEPSASVDQVMKGNSLVSYCCCHKG